MSRSGTIAMRRPVVAAVLTAALVVAACGPTSISPSAPRAEATGVVLRIERTGRRVDGFVLRTGTGDELRFTIGPLDVGDGAFPADHLAEHQLSADPVRVVYVEQEGEHVAIRLTDAP